MLYGKYFWTLPKKIPFDSICFGYLLNFDYVHKEHFIEEGGGGGQGEEEITFGNIKRKLSKKRHSNFYYGFTFGILEHLAGNLFGRAIDFNRGGTQLPIWATNDLLSFQIYKAPPPWILQTPSCHLHWCGVLWANAPAFSAFACFQGSLCNIHRSSALRQSATVREKEEWLWRKALSVKQRPKPMASLPLDLWWEGGLWGGSKQTLPFQCQDDLALILELVRMGLWGISWFQKEVMNIRKLCLISYDSAKIPMGAKWHCTQSVAHSVRAPCPQSEAGFCSVPFSLNEATS